MTIKKKIGIAVIAMLCICALISGGVFIHQYTDAKKSTEAFDSLTELITDTEVPENADAAEDQDTTEQTINEMALAYEKYAALYEQNDDFVGWISIDGTIINYPVMQTRDDPDYYLKHSFDKAYSDYGVPYVDEACAVGLSANTVIYGHHMKNGTMFSALVNYADKSFFEEHPIITFNSLYGFGEYQIIAVFSFDTNNETFRYNEFADGSKEQFDEFIAECMARRAYDTGYTAEYGDELLTLSTCEYTHNNGRFVVVAKKL